MSDEQSLVYWSQWWRDAQLCRYGSQPIQAVRGITRELNVLEKRLFQRALLENIEDEVQPLPGTNPSGKT